MITLVLGEYPRPLGSSASWFTLIISSIPWLVFPVWVPTAWGVYSSPEARTLIVCTTSGLSWNISEVWVTADTSLRYTTVSGFSTRIFFAAGLEDGSVISWLRNTSGVI